MGWSVASGGLGSVGGFKTCFSGNTANSLAVIVVALSWPWSSDSASSPATIE